MEEKLALRIQLFRDTGQVRPEVAEFVRDELEALATSGRTVTEETAGMLTSHLMMALTRLVNGEALKEFPTDESVAAELADRPESVGLAQQVAERAQQSLGALLPRSEINFLAMHLAVLEQHSAPIGTCGTGSGHRQHHGPTAARRAVVTKILTGGVGKVQVAEALAELGIDGLEVTVSNDMDAAMKLRAGQADFYLGTCHTGAGASLGVLLGVLGSTTCHTFGRGIPTAHEVTELIDGGTKVFGYGMDQISAVTPVIAHAIAARTF